MEQIETKRLISKAEFANIYIPFGILLIVALIAAELTQDLTYHRIIYSIWVATVFLAPALCLYILPGKSEVKNNYELLLWTFAFLAYGVHFFYSVIIHFHASIQEVYAAQGIAIATSNFLLTIWWLTDVLLVWFKDASAKWMQIEKLGSRIYIGGAFFVADVILFEGFVRILGILMTVAIAICVVIRIWTELKLKKAS